MKFAWDDKKAQTNLAKHGVAFDEACTAFNDPEAVRIFDPNHSEKEDRFVLLGLSSKLRLLVVCHCYRADEREIRIISARKATKNEASDYAGKRHA